MVGKTRKVGQLVLVSGLHRNRPIDRKRLTANKYCIVRVEGKARSLWPVIWFIFAACD